MSVSNIVDNAIEETEDYLDSLPKVSAKMLGLDPRAGRVWVDIKNESIIVKNAKSSIDYYGGFEYIDTDCRADIGPYTVFLTGDDRVAIALDHYEFMAAETETA